MDGTDSPFSFVTFKPCSRVEPAEQAAHPHSHQNPSPAPCAGHSICSCPALGENSRRHRAHVSRARPRARSYFWSYFWRAASRGAEAAELRGTDRKRKALVFRTGREVSQPPAGKDGRRPGKNKRGLQRSVAAGLQRSSKATSVRP